MNQLNKTMKYESIVLKQLREESQYSSHICLKKLMIKCCLKHESVKYLQEVMGTQMVNPIHFH